MQLFAKFKKIPRRGFRATLNFRKFNATRTSPPGPTFVSEVPLRNLLTSIFNLVPCDRIVHRAYLSSSVHIDIERVREANEWDIECEHEKINSICPSVHVLFCLLYKHTNNDVFDYFPKIYEDFPKLFGGLTNVSEHFPKIAEDCLRYPKISEEVPMIFRSYNTTSEYFLSDYVAIAMAILRLVTTTWYFHM